MGYLNISNFYFKVILSSVLINHISREALFLLLLRAAHPKNGFPLVLQGSSLLFLTALSILCVLISYSSSPNGGEERNCT